MKYISLFSLLLFPCLLAFGQKSTAIRVESATMDETILTISAPMTKLIPVKGDEEKLLFVDKSGTSILKKGAPDLQKLSTALMIPATADMKVEILAATFHDIADVKIAPSKGNLTRNINPKDVPFIYGEEYQKDAFYPENLAELTNPYILRDVRGQALWIYPVRYNPVTKTLRVYENITLRVFAAGENQENAMQRTSPSQNVDKEFEAIYQQQFVNYAAKTTTYTPVSEEGTMLIICHSAFMGTMKPFVDWKKQKGITTALVDVSTIGLQTTAIKSYIQQYYSTHPTLKYVLLVGDNPQIPCMTYNGNPSDNAYAYLQGNDSYPEVFMGRFSAQNVTELQTQIDRTITYEKMPNATATWYNKGLCIASEEGPGDDNEMDYEHEHGLRSQLLAYNYTQVTELYDGTQTQAGYTDAPGNPTATDVVAAIQSGVSIINYTGHGGPTNLVTTDFNVTDAQVLENEGKFPFMWVVGCVSGEFMNTTCLAEACLRAKHPINGNPTGAIAAMMSTINQSWDPPMEGQDAMNAILTENTAGNIKRTFGGLSFNGCMQMNDAYNTSGAEMTDTWTLFGDPSVMVFTNTPAAMTVTHALSTMIGTANFTVNCNENGALVSLTQNGEIIGTGNVSNGSVNIAFAQALYSISPITVTVTDYNNVPYIGTVQVNVPNSPFIGLAIQSLDDSQGNNNNLADFSEAVKLNIDAHNYGLQSANNVSATITTSDPYLTITDGNATFGNIANSASVIQNAAYQVQIANNAPDQHNALCTANITDTNGNSWTSTLSILLNAPQLSALTMQINDVSGNNNGFIDPNETLTLIIHNKNFGHAAANAMATLAVNNSLITIQNTTVNVGLLSANGGLADATFTITADASIAKGTPLQFTYQLNAGAYQANANYDAVIAPNIINFEPNNTTNITWVNSGNQPWFVSNNSPYEGTNCNQSGAIINSEQSIMAFSYDITQADTISFYRKVSSEEDYDYLYFYVDNVELEKWSGEKSWERKAYFVTAGIHTFKWKYEKDNYVSSGQDAAYIDYIEVPNGASVVGLANPIVDREISLFPSPASETIFISFDLKNNESSTIQLFNLNGQLIQSLIPQAGEAKIEVNGLAKGIYFVRVMIDERVWTQKVVVE